MFPHFFRGCPLSPFLLLFFATNAHFQLFGWFVYGLSLFPSACLDHTPFVFVFLHLVHTFFLDRPPLLLFELQKPRFFFFFPFVRSTIFLRFPFFPSTCFFLSGTCLVHFVFFFFARILDPSLRYSFFFFRFLSWFSDFLVFVDSPTPSPSDALTFS